MLKCEFSQFRSSTARSDLKISFAPAPKFADFLVDVVGWIRQQLAKRKQPHQQQQGAAAASSSASAAASRAVMDLAIVFTRDRNSIMALYFSLAALLTAEEFATVAFLHSDLSGEHKTEAQRLASSGDYTLVLTTSLFGQVRVVERACCATVASILMVVCVYACEGNIY